MARGGQGGAGGSGVTEVEWLSSGDPEVLLRRLSGPVDPFEDLYPRLSERKLLLFNIAAERHFNTYEADGATRTRIDAKCLAGEKLADGDCTMAEVIRACYPDLSDDSVQDSVPYEALPEAQSWVHLPYGAEWINGAAEFLCGVIRDIYGNPFRPVNILPQAPHMVCVRPNGTFPAEWLLWSNGTIPVLAESIYQERAWDLLPILADALEDASCSDPEILEHCRNGLVHTRGCWVLDLLTGRE
jgi:hypothetical protein